MNWPKVAMVFFSVSALASWRIQAEGFTLEGIVDHVRFGPEGVSGTNKFQFTVYFNEGKWRNLLEDLLVKEGKKQGIPSWETAFDGTDHYKIVHLAGSRPEKKSALPYGDYGYVKTGELSTEESLSLNLLWLGFESGNYFAHLKESVMISIFPVPPTNRLHFSLPSILKGSGLPERLSIDFPGTFSVVRAEIKDESKPEPGPRLVTNTVVYPSPFDGGYRAGDYQVLSKTNIGEWEVPLAARFDYFVLRTTAPSKVERVLIERTSLLVTRLEVNGVAEPIDVRPAFSSGDAHIYDYRFTNITPQLGYTEKNRKWLDRASPSIEATVKRLARTNAQENRPSSRAKWVTPFFIGILVMSLGVIFCQQYRNKKNK